MTSSNPNTDKVTSIPRLNRDVIKRGKKLFGPNGLDEKAKEEVNERYKGLPERARPKIDTRTGQLRQPGTLFDPLNLLGGQRSRRQRTIDRIVEEGGQDFINSFDPSTKTFGDLSTWDQYFHGVTHDDAVKAVLRQNETLRNNDPELSADLDELERQGIEVDSLTTNRSIRDRAQNFRDIKSTTTAIREMLPEGDARLKELGDNPTLDQLRALQAELKPLTQAGRAAEATIRNLDSQIQNRSDTLELSKLQERNRTALSFAEIDFQNSTNKYNWMTANADRDYKYRAAEADRELKKELALLGFEDKAADRRYDREERRDQNRQLMILQMMKGLQNFGSAFTL